MLNVKVIAAMTPGKVTLETVEFDENALPADKVLVKTLYSAVSAGTEKTVAPSIRTSVRMPAE